MNKYVLQLFLAFALIAQGWLVHAHAPHSIAGSLSTAPEVWAAAELPPCHQKAETGTETPSTGTTSNCCGDDCGCAAQCGVIASYVMNTAIAVLDERAPPAFVSAEIQRPQAAHRMPVPRPPNF